MNNSVMGLHKNLSKFYRKDKQVINLINTNVGTKIVGTLLTQVETDKEVYKGKTTVEGLEIDLPELEVDSYGVKEHITLGGVTLRRYTELEEWGPQYVKDLDARIRVIKLNRRKEFTPLQQTDFTTLEEKGEIIRVHRNRRVTIRKLQDKVITHKHGYGLQVETYLTDTRERKTVYWFIKPTLAVHIAKLVDGNFTFTGITGLRAIVI